MKSKCTRRFWKLYETLPGHVRKRADKAYELWKGNPNHRSLAFKKLKGGADNRFSIRVGDHHRALGQLNGDTVEWVWIGSHEDYNNFI